MPSILMPALSPTMEEGKLAKWLKKVGDEVKAGDVIAEIETDKATMEVEAVDEGTLSSILVPEGTESVKVNTPIAVVQLAPRGERFMSLFRLGWLRFSTLSTQLGPAAIPHLARYRMAMFGFMACIIAMVAMSILVAAERSN